MKYLSVSLFLCFIFVWFPEWLWGKPYQYGKIIVPVSQVYESPNFDSRVLGVFKENQVVILSKKRFGFFYKVRLKKGSWGFLSDVEVEPSAIPPVKTRVENTQKKVSPDVEANKRKSMGSQQLPLRKQKREKTKRVTKKIPEKKVSKTVEKEKDASEIKKDEKIEPAKETENAEDKKQEKDSKPKKPFVWQKWIGPTLGTVHYREVAIGKPFNEPLLFYGVQASGPDLLFSGGLSTVNFLVHYGAPDYFKKTTGNDASGFMVMFDGQLDIPFDSSTNHLLTMGVGPFVIYNKYDIKAGQVPFSIEELRLGATFNVSFGFALYDYAVKAQVKYVLEKEKYLSYFLSFQFPY